MEIPLLKSTWEYECIFARSLFVLKLIVSNMELIGFYETIKMQYYSGGGYCLLWENILVLIV